MIIVDFTKEHISEAAALAHANYKEEQQQVPALSDMDNIPGLAYFASNGMGVAAFEQEEMVGFLCATAPFEQAFGSTDSKGVFSPMGAHAAKPENREKIYAAMYQQAADKWVRAGAVSHAVCLYAHDKAAQKQFFRYGFGLRCMDSIRSMEAIDGPSHEEYEFIELEQDDYGFAYPLELMLNEHYQNSPFFMNRNPEDCDAFCRECVSENERCFAAYYNGNICAYLKISESGETFITERSNYRHITSAYCLKEYRGKGLYQNLLNYVIQILKKEGCTHLGVDFESINPTAYGFWSKYFTAYTYSVVRRIDERILEADV